MDRQCEEEIRFPLDGEKMDERQNRGGLILDADLTSVVVARLCQRVAAAVVVFQKDCYLGGELPVAVLVVVVFQKDCYLGGELPVAESRYHQLLVMQLELVLRASLRMAQSALVLLVALRRRPLVHAEPWSVQPDQVRVRPKVRLLPLA